MNFYKNGNYIVCMMDDGTKIRHTKDDEFHPRFAENCDVKITDKCSIGCPFCYEGCTAHGQYADLLSYSFLKTLHPFTELAINGNDMDHPQLNAFLSILKYHKVYANITVHQMQFMKNYDRIKQLSEVNLIYGIGVSYQQYDDEFIQRIKEFPNAVLHTINGLLSQEDVKKLSNHDLKLLILGYKDLGRGTTYHHSRGKNLISKNQAWMYQNIESMVHDGGFKTILFDNLAIEQLDIKHIMTPDEWDKFYMGDDGQFTFYIDMVRGEFAKNSISQVRYPITDDMTIDDMFNKIRNEKV